MKEIGAKKSLFSKIDHVGVVVRDLNKAIEYYQSLGIGPFKPPPISPVTDKTMYGKPIDFKLKVALAQVGTIDIELLQPVENAPVHEDFLKSRGEGIHHMAFLVADINKETAELTEKEPDVILTSRRPTGGAAYFDTSKIGGVVIELLQRAPKIRGENDIEKREAESPFSKVDQVGVIVKDMNKAIEYYQSLGIRPFESSKLTPTDRKVYGKPADDVRNLIKSAWIEQVQFELIQPISGESVQRKFLESKGEGISHLAFFVDDIDKKTAKLVRKGFNVISSGKFAGGGGYAYFDTDRVGGVQFELLQWPPK